ncbi:MAG: ABC-F family ATP-binding cassette domain-containing protein [Proteobacteria bacterium]|nr:ABC-F family ATP-binding cassette domain-containing protein [Pseudomonadota bacterium]
MAPPILILRDIDLTFGGTPLLEGAEISISKGDRLCLVGRNGSGKSTLLKIAAGLVDPDRGERFLQPGTTIRYLPQEPDLSGYGSTLDYVEEGMDPDEPSHRAQHLLDLLGLSGGENPARLSGGEARRCALARALAPKPDILLLDEPTNHLDMPAIQWLEKELKGLPSAIVMISHDRRFLENLSRATVWLDRGQINRLDKGFADFEEWRDETLEQEALDRHKLDRRIVAENHWLVYGVTARRKRNQRRLGDLVEMRQQRSQLRKVTGDVKMTVTVGNVSGKLVAEAESISKSYDSGPDIIIDFSVRILRGDRVGFIGPNGAGKTTLLNILTGVSQPDHGTARLGASVQMVTLDQKRESLDAKATLADTLTGGGGDMVSVAGQTRHVISYMKDFLFSPEQAQTPIGELSGGERGRLMLARALASPSNLLVLDEPTNDLDLETLDLLQEMLADYQGAVMLVSHDRDFIDRVVTSVIAYEGDGRWVEYAGGYTDMLAQQRLAVEEEKMAKKSPAASASSPASSPPGRKGKLSFHQTHALKTLPREITALERQIESHRKTLADPNLYARDPEAFNTAAAVLQDAEGSLAVLEEEWLALEMEREAIEAGKGK